MCIVYCWMCQMKQPCREVLCWDLPGLCTSGHTILYRRNQWTSHSDATLREANQIDPKIYPLSSNVCSSYTEWSCGAWSVSPFQRTAMACKAFMSCMPVLLNFLASALAAIVSLFPHVDQFRWPGIYIVIHSVLMFVTTLLLFQGKDGSKTDDSRKSSCRECASPRPMLPVPVFVSSH